MPQATISNPGDRSKPLASPGSLNTSPLKRPRYTISEDQTKDRDVRKKRVLAFSKRHCPTSPPKRQPVPSGDSAPIRPPPLPPWIQNQNGPGQRVDGTQQPSEDPEKEFKDLLYKYKNVKRLYFDGKTEIEHLTGRIEELQENLAMRMRTEHVEATKHAPDNAEAHKPTPDRGSDSKSNIEKPVICDEDEIDRLARRVEELQVGASEETKPADDNRAEPSSCKNLDTSDVLERFAGTAKAL